MPTFLRCLEVGALRDDINRPCGAVWRSHCIPQRVAAKTTRLEKSCFIRTQIAGSFVCRRRRKSLDSIRNPHQDCFELTLKSVKRTYSYKVASHSANGTMPAETIIDVPADPRRLALFTSPTWSRPSAPPFDSTPANAPAHQGCPWG